MPQRVIDYHVMQVGAKRKVEASEPLMFLAAMEEGAEERAQQVEER